MQVSLRDATSKWSIDQELELSSEKILDTAYSISAIISQKMSHARKVPRARASKFQAVHTKLVLESECDEADGTEIGDESEDDDGAED